MRIGRNDPCPCGSGKKYKHCCLNASARTATESPELLAWRRVRRALDGFPARMLKFVSEAYGPVALVEAWGEFHLSLEEDELEFDPDSPFMPVFMPWFFHAWEPDVDTEVEDESLHGRAPTAEFLRRRGGRLEPVLRRYLEACVEAPFGFYEILHAQPGRGFHAREVLMGEERQVIERSGSEQMQRGDILFGQLVEIDGIVMLEASSPVLLPPADKVEVMELRERVMKFPESASPEERLREWDIEIREVYLGLAGRILYPVPPELRNTDDELIVPHRLVFDIDGAGAAFQALKHLSVSQSEEELLASAQVGADGEIEHVSITWSKLDNAIHASWESTTLGTVEIRPGRLVGEVNSAERAAELRRLVEEALGAEARHRVTEIQNIERALDEARDPGEASRFGIGLGEEDTDLSEMPEVKVQIQQFMAAHYEEWVSSKIPALGNRTPLEAVADPEGRERVEALVTQLERSGGPMSSVVDPAILRRLRERLGLQRPEE